MKKLMYLCILCCVILTGCKSKTDSAVTSEAQITFESVTTFTTIENSQNEASVTSTNSYSTDTKSTTTQANASPKSTEKPAITTQKASTTAPVTTTKAATTTNKVSNLSKENINEINQYVKKVSQSYGIGTKCAECNNEGAVVLTGDIDLWHGYSWDTPTNTKISKTVDSIKKCVDSDIKRMYNEWQNDGTTPQEISLGMYIKIYWEKINDGYYNLYLMW